MFGPIRRFVRAYRVREVAGDRIDLPARFLFDVVPRPSLGRDNDETGDAPFAGDEREVEPSAAASPDEIMRSCQSFVSRKDQPSEPRLRTASTNGFRNARRMPATAATDASISACARA